MKIRLIGESDLSPLLSSLSTFHPFFVLYYKNHAKGLLMWQKQHDKSKESDYSHFEATHDRDFVGKKYPSLTRKFLLYNCNEKLHPDKLFMRSLDKNACDNSQLS